MASHISKNMVKYSFGATPVFVMVGNRSKNINDMPFERCSAFIQEGTSKRNFFILLQ